MGNARTDRENGDGAEYLIKVKRNPITPNFQQTPLDKNYSPSKRRQSCS